MAVTISAFRYVTPCTFIEVVFAVETEAVRFFAVGTFRQPEWRRMTKDGSLFV